jgi:hypothetical protein
MAAKAKKVAEVARDEVARLRMERKALEEAVARRGAELEAIRQTTAQEVERRRDAELQRAVEAAARQKAEEAAREVAVERARREVAEADARKAVQAVAEATEREAETRRTEREDELSQAREKRRERLTRWTRQVGNVAASIGIVGLAIFGADRVFRWPEGVGNVPTAAVPGVSTTRSAEAHPSEGLSGRVDSFGAAAWGSGAAGAPLVVMPPDFEASVPGVADPEIVLSEGDSRLSLLDALADSADGAMESFRALVSGFESGAADCDDLKTAYVEMDRRWVAYAVNGVSRLDGGLDEDRGERHRNLTRGMQRIKLAYEVTGCPLP